MKVPDRQTAARNWMTSEDVRTKLRAEIPAADKWAYFDHAAVSPIPREAARAASKMLSQCSESGDFHWPDWSASASRLRKNAACLIHTEPKNIALIPNTTFGINLIANTFPWFEQQDSEIRESAQKSSSEGSDRTHEHFQLRALSNSNLSGHLHPPNVVCIRIVNHCTVCEVDAH